MAIPIYFNFKTRYYTVATTSSSGAPTSFCTVAARCKVVGTVFLPNNAGTSTNVTGYDVVAFQGNSATATVVTSGASVTTSTGTFGTLVLAANNVYLNAGDVIATLGSTSQGGFVTHIVGEF